MGKINFSEKEKNSIKEAVSKVEKTTSGEIVTFYSKKSDQYTEVSLWAGLFAVLFSLILANTLSYFWLLPVKFNILNFSILIIVISTVVFVVVNFIKPLKRKLIRYNRKALAVHKKANEIFLNEEVFNTKERTGILIFISEFEHMVEIIADSGINKKISDEDRQEIIETIIKGIKNKNTAEGIITAIHFYGNLLVNAGYSIKPDDLNELADDLKTD